MMSLTFSFDFVRVRLVLWFEFEALGYRAEEHFAIKVSYHHHPTARSMESIRTHLIFTQSL